MKASKFWSRASPVGPLNGPLALVLVFQINSSRTPKWATILWRPPNFGPKPLELEALYSTSKYGKAKYRLKFSHPAGIQRWFQASKFYGSTPKSKIGIKFNYPAGVALTSSSLSPTFLRRPLVTEAVLPVLTPPVASLVALHRPSRTLSTCAVLLPPHYAAAPPGSAGVVLLCCQCMMAATRRCAAWPCYYVDVPQASRAPRPAVHLTAVLPRHRQPATCAEEEEEEETPDIFNILL